MQGFFLSAGPARVSKDNYYKLELLSDLEKKPETQSPDEKK